MSQNAAHPAFAAIVVAAGSGQRAGQSLPKQFVPWRGMPVLRHSVQALHDAGARPIIVAIPDGYDEHATEAVRDIDDVHLVVGGATRQSSVRIGLQELASDPPEIVLIHDAARPDLPAQVISRILVAAQEFGGAIPVLPVIDSLAVIDGNDMTEPSARDTMRRVQTPQGFHYADIVSAHDDWKSGIDAGDDAQIHHAAGGRVRVVDGDERLKKLTYETDFTMKNTSPTSGPAAIRTGLGYDVHRLATGEELWLCGLRIEHDFGLVGHSDADVVLHAVVDALLGAVGAGDIGDHFPPSDDRWRGATSALFVEHAATLVERAGYHIANVDCTIICEAPKIGPHRTAMRQKLSQLLQITIGQVSVKATTTEGLGFTGRREGIAAQAIATVAANCALK